MEAGRFPPGHRTRCAEVERNHRPQQGPVRRESSGLPLLCFVPGHSSGTPPIHEYGGIEIAEPRVNGGIRAKEVRVIAPDGEQIGIKSIQEAMWLANQLELDLVEVAPEARPPVTKIMDYGKFKYEQSVRDREARKNQTRTVIKEVRLRPSTGEHDYQMVRRRAEEFLMHGDKVKVTIRFRGRENERPELGRNLVDRLVSEIGDIVTVEQAPRKEGRQMHAVLAPNTTAIKRRKEEAEEAEADEVEAADAEADEVEATNGTASDPETAPADEEE